MAVALPSQLPLQLASVVEKLTDKAGGSFKVPDSFAVQPLASVTVTVYVPAQRLFMVCVLSPVFQLYVYGDVPPEGFAVALPSQLPLQDGSVVETVTSTGAGSTRLAVSVV